MWNVIDFIAGLAIIALLLVVIAGLIGTTIAICFLIWKTIKDWKN